MPTPEQTEAAEAQIVEKSKWINFYITEYSVELLASKMRTGEFEIPAYQREDTWEPRRKSRFIESAWGKGAFQRPWSPPRQRCSRQNWGSAWGVPG